MDPWIIWIIFAVTLVIVELLTQWVSSFCLAIGCIAALVAYLLGCDTVWQLVWLAIGTIVGFVCFIPVFKKRVEKRRLASLHEPVSNMDALIGRTGRVIVAIPAGGIGRMRIDGDNWQAECSLPIAEGAMARVEGYDSIILKVVPADK